MSELLITLRRRLHHERGESAVFWSLGVVVMVGVIALVVAPEVSSEWRNFVGKPLP